MVKPNYRQAKRQKEIAKKTKQQAKQERRSARLETTENPAPASETAQQDGQTINGKQSETLDTQS